LAIFFDLMFNLFAKTGDSGDEEFVGVRSIETFFAGEAHVKTGFVFFGAIDLFKAKRGGLKIGGERLEEFVELLRKALVDESFDSICNFNTKSSDLKIH